MLAYVFWHRPRDASEIDAYERAQLAFQRSLARTRPMGMCGSAVFRLAEIPWLAGAETETGAETGAGADGDGDSNAAGYEDWYLLDDFAALGVLNEAAVGHGHRSRHDDVARRYGEGTASLYGLIEGDRGADLLAAAAVAVWVARAPGATQRMTGEMLGDGVDPAHASLWRRHLVLGPAPEFCLLADDRSRLSGASGVSPTRLPQGWSATTLERETLWHG
jgi:hypothetical protein